MPKNKADSQLIKDVNKRLILGVIERKYNISRAEIARETGLSPTTVSTLIGELEHDELVKGLGQGLIRRGRRPVMYQINHEARYIVAADVGSNVLTVLVTDLKFNIIKEIQANVGEQVGQELIRSLYQNINEGINTSGIDRSKIIGVGVASPGLVDHVSGTVVKAFNLQWEAMPLKGILEHELGLPVYVENMNHAAAVGEFVRGLNQEARRFLYLNIGRGVGASIILNGEILRGSKVSVGELGHFIMDRHGEKCTCGARGCLETLVSVRAIEGKARRIAKEYPESLLWSIVQGNLDEISLDTVIQAAKQNDSPSVNLLIETGEWIGIAIAGMINIFNPDVIMLGGRVMRTAGDILLNTVKNYARDNSIPVLFKTATFTTPRLGHLSSVMGAIAFVYQEEFKKLYVD
jgi:N-acetylglucosamine repressor